MNVGLTSLAHSLIRAAEPFALAGLIVRVALILAIHFPTILVQASVAWPP